jgi:prepilin-type N-terminal cleavage/methylation domain-containing protein
MGGIIVVGQSLHKLRQMRQMTFEKIKTNRSGFTLLEVVFAIFILSLSGFASFTLIESALVPASLNRSNLTAYYLAQEGVELVRNIRDNNWLEGNDWREGLNVGDWEIDYNDSALSAYIGRYLYIDDGTNLFSYIESPSGGDELTKFKRKIIISELADDIIQVSVVVEWSERGTERDTTIINQLTEWK